MKVSAMKPPSRRRCLEATASMVVSLTPSALCLVALHFDLVPIGVEAMLGFIALYVVSTTMLITFLMRRHQGTEASPVEQLESQEEEATSDPPRYEDIINQTTFGTVTSTMQQNEELSSTINSAELEPPPSYHEVVITVNHV